MHWWVRSLLHFGLGTLCVPTHQYVVMKAVMEKSSAKKFRLTESRVLHLRVVFIVRQGSRVAAGEGARSRAIFWTRRARSRSRAALRRTHTWPAMRRLARASPHWAPGSQLHLSTLPPPPLFFFSHAVSHEPSAYRTSRCQRIWRGICVKCSPFLSSLLQLLLN